MKKDNPFELHTVTPYLIVDDVEGLVLFMQQVFGGELRGELQYRDDGSVQHGEIKLGDSIVMMGSPMADISALPAALYIYVPDCDQIYERAVCKGATPVLAPANYPHGDRYGGVRDANGNIFWIVTHLESIKN